MEDIFLQKNLPVKTSQVLKILYEYDLSGNKRLQIIEIGNRLMVLGLSDSNIQLIAEISDKDSVAEIKLNCEKENKTEKPDFFLVLTNTIKNKIADWITPQKNMAQSTISDIKENLAGLRQNPQKTFKRIRENKSFFKDLNENV